MIKSLFRIPQFCSRDFQAKYLIQSCWASQKTSAVLLYALPPFTSSYHQLSKYFSSLPPLPPPYKDNNLLSHKKNNQLFLHILRLYQPYYNFLIDCLCKFGTILGICVKNRSNSKIRFFPKPILVSSNISLWLKNNIWLPLPELYEAWT